MTTRSIAPLLAVLVAGIALFFLWPTIETFVSKDSQQVACTMEAKICPDGSAVGRSGPQCEFAPCPVAVAVPGDITLGVGQKGKIGNMEITFNAFVQDSRCPVDVQCIQAGAVNINVTFAQGPHVETKNMPSDEVPQKFEEYSISIVGVLPPAISTQQIDPKDYRITFRVSN